MNNAAALIDAYSKERFHTEYREDWAVGHIEAALSQGPHPSADAEDAMKELHNDTKEKVSNGYSKVIRYRELKKNLPEKLKISPVAMIPHKSLS